MENFDFNFFKPKRKTTLVFPNESVTNSLKKIKELGKLTPDELFMKESLKKGLRGIEKDKEISE